MAAWDSADLLERWKLWAGRGTGGVMDADELWTDARVYMVLADAQEQVFADMAPVAPHAFVSPPVQLTTSDGGVTYTFGSAYPFAHVEVYAQETGGRELYATDYGDGSGDFVIEGNIIRSPGNRVRSYTVGPYARYTSFPARISASQAPSLDPEPARELILWKALEIGADVSQGAMDPTPWRARYEDARRRWTIVWQTQYRPGTPRGAWWLRLADWNGET